MPQLPSPSLLALTLATALLGAACSRPGERPGPAAAPDKGRATSTQTSDQGRCEYKGRVDREAIETSALGSILPNVRRVFQFTAFSDGERRRILVCREVDTNFDGVKDVIRLYSDKGEVISEEADSNYDGKIDTWLNFTAGRLSKESRDTNFDGNPDLWKFFVIDDELLANKEKSASAHPKLQRIQRDLNFDGKPDVWEFYEKEHLERIGIDLDHDGRVDRWDHDAVARQARTEEQIQKSKAQEAKPASGTPAE